MAEKKLSPELFRHRWIHSFEEDSVQAQVYRPQSWDFPLSRRPREAFELRAEAQLSSFYRARKTDQKRQTHRGPKKKGSRSSAQSKRDPVARSPYALSSPAPTRSLFAAHSALIPAPPDFVFNFLNFLPSTTTSSKKFTAYRLRFLLGTV